MPFPKSHPISCCMTYWMNSNHLAVSSWKAQKVVHEIRDLRKIQQSWKTASCHCHMAYPEWKVPDVTPGDWTLCSPSWPWLQLRPWMSPLEQCREQVHMSPGISSRDRIILMMRASQAIPKRIHRDTMFLYHKGYLRDGSIPGKRQGQRRWGLDGNWRPE